MWGGMETLRVGRNILYTVYADIITITYINICLEDPPNEDILTQKHDIIMARAKHWIEISKGGIRDQQIVSSLIFPNVFFTEYKPFT